MSNTFPTVKIVQKDYTRKDWSQNIFLRLTINRKIRYFPLNIYANPKWFKSRNEDPISRSDPDSKYKNNLLNHYFLTQLAKFSTTKKTSIF